MRQLHPSFSRGEVTRMNRPSIIDQLPKRLDQTLGQQRHPVLATLALTHGDLQALYVHILHPKRARFTQAQSAAIHHLHEQLHQG